MDKRAILQSSSDREELMKTALALCQSGDPKDLQTVLGFLKDPAFLNRLDSRDDYSYALAHLRVRKILDAIGKLPGDKAEAALLEVGASKAFMDHHWRVEFLVVATGHIRNPSPKLLDFLDDQVKSTRVQAFTLVSVLAAMRSPAACQRIERGLSTPGKPLDGSVFNMEVIKYRNDPAIVSMYNRLLAKKIEDARLRDAIVQSLFDFRPTDWFPPAVRPPKLHSRREASTEVLRELLVVADQSLHLDIPENTKGGVRKARAEIEAILKFRQEGGPERIAKLITDLDDKRFAVRDQVARELEKFGDWAEPQLRAALERNPTPEMRQRILQVLAKLER